MPYRNYFDKLPSISKKMEDSYYILNSGKNKTKWGTLVMCFQTIKGVLDMCIFKKWQICACVHSA